MKGNFQVRFLGEKGGVILPTYPTSKYKAAKEKKVGMVRFKLTIDGFLRTTALIVLVMVSIY